MTTSERPGSQARGAPDAIGVSGPGQFVNLTQHEIRIKREGRNDLILPPRAIPARVAYIQQGSFLGIPIMKRVGDVEELPPSTPGTFYITSRLVKDAVPDRLDVVVPFGLVKDKSTGDVLYCRGVAL